MSLIPTIARRAAPSVFAPLARFPMFDDLDRELRDFAEGAFTTPLGTRRLSQVVGWVPATELTENQDELLLTAELPGLDRKDIDIAVDEGVLTIRGEKAEERKEGEEDKKYYLWERTYGSFQRSFVLPRNIDATKITAEFEKGVLKVRLPKTAESKAKGRKIEIKAS